MASIIMVSKHFKVLGSIRNGNKKLLTPLNLRKAVVPCLKDTKLITITNVHNLQATR